ncbi:hypothetical protein L7F22_061760 [Adiantum nelumboides]|nr:hypothetical protein [Adiantum nelumboides]
MAKPTSSSILAYHINLQLNYIRSTLSLQNLVLALLSFGFIGLIICFGTLLSTKHTQNSALITSKLANHRYSCLSRSQRSLLRVDVDGATEKILLPHLLSQAWDHYTFHHTQCHHIVDEDGVSNHSSVQGCQYLLFSDAQECGLGNRLASLASALAYAIATDRVLLLDNSRNLGNLLCEPLPSSSWLLPSGSPYHSKIRGAPSLAAYMASDHGAVVARIPANVGDGADAKDETVKVSLWDEPRNEDMAFFSEGVYERLRQVKWIIWESDLYTIPNLFLVSSFWRRMHPLFSQREDEAFALMSHLILNPADDVWAMVLKEYMGYMADASSRVGVQIRLHGRRDRAIFDEDAMSTTMACLINNSYLPVPISGNQSLQHPSTAAATNRASLYAKKILSGRKAGNQGRRQTGAARVDVAVLVASLQSKYFLRMKAVYSEGAGAEDGRVVRVHAVSGMQVQDFSYRQAQLALAEMWLLSGSERLAISASSTFGYAAQAWGGLRPLILSFGTGKEAAAVQCKRGYSRDPCSHLPRPAPAFNLTELAVPHQQWILRHVRTCQDRPSGAWQLVPAQVHLQTAPPVFNSSL